mgnify:CR=1 FL=1
MLVLSCLIPHIVLYGGDKMTSEIKCLVCNGKYFRKGYYDIDSRAEIYSTAYHNIKSDESIDIYTDIVHETHINSDLEFRLKSEDKKRYSTTDDFADVYKYSCEDCGYIMSFTKEKQVESKLEENERKKKENTYDWTNFK